MPKFRKTQAARKAGENVRFSLGMTLHALSVADAQTTGVLKDVLLMEGDREATGHGFYIDSKTLDTALQDNGSGVRAAAARIGGTAATQADRALSDSGGVGVSYNRLSAAAKSQAARQTELSNLASAQASATVSTSSQNSISSYLQVLSL